MACQFYNACITSSCGVAQVCCVRPKGYKRCARKRGTRYAAVPLLSATCARGRAIHHACMAERYCNAASPRTACCSLCGRSERAMSAMGTCKPAALCCDAPKPLNARLRESTFAVTGGAGGVGSAGGWSLQSPSNGAEHSVRDVARQTKQRSNGAATAAAAAYRHRRSQHQRYVWQQQRLPQMRAETPRQWTPHAIAGGHAYSAWSFGHHSSAKSL